MRRRDVMAGLGVLATQKAVAAPMPWLSPDLPDGTRAIARMVRPPGKQGLIQLTDRPPNLETPIQALNAAITPTEQFFVRYHHANIPEEKTFDNWSLEIGGDAAERPARLTMRQLEDLPQTDVTAICLCAGNRRGLVQPHVPGVQWGHGAMGCATWHGPRLRDVLAKAGVKPDAVEIWFEGADTATLPNTPAFHKSLPLAKAIANETIVATTMNGGPLPLLNGYPVRLVVPGWTGTYWMKHLTRITISRVPLENFWMKTAYRVPAGLFPFGSPFPSQDRAANVPVTDIAVNSLISWPIDGDEVERSGFKARGLAWDNGRGIRRVDVSLDDGKNWQSALLDRELGPYAFRTWSLDTGPLPRGTVSLRVRAINNGRDAQPDTYVTNPSGYHNNSPHRSTVKVV